MQTIKIIPFMRRFQKMLTKAKLRQQAKINERKKLARVKREVA